MSFTNLFYHIVFHTKHNAMVITEEHENLLYAYIHGYCKHTGVRLLRIGGMPDHIHMLVAIPPQIAVSTFVKQVKVASSKMLCENSQFKGFDGWQSGYGAFTYSQKDVEMIVNYIKKQKEHHKHISFRDEYRLWLIENGISEDAPFFPK